MNRKTEKEWLVLLWQRASGIVLTEDLIKIFYERCRSLLNYSTSVLQVALQQARKDRNFKLAHIADLAEQEVKERRKAKVRGVIEDKKRDERIVRKQPVRRTRPVDHYPKKRGKSKTEFDYWFVAPGPSEPNDRDLHKRIGPTQKYDDDL